MAGEYTSRGSRPLHAAGGIEQALLSLAQQLHEAALDPDRWPDVLRAVRHRILSWQRTGVWSSDHDEWLESIVQNASRTCAEVARLTAARAAAGSVRDAVAVAIVILDAKHHVLHANPAAERLVRSLIGRVGVETGSREEEPIRCLRQIVALLPEWPDLETGVPVVMRVAPRGLSQLEVLAIPLPADSDPYSFPDGRTLLFIVDPAAGQGPDETLLRTAFDLTPAEARMAARLCQGNTVDEAARALGIRITTARTHLARLFLKTGTARQAELLRALLMLPVTPSPAPRSHSKNDETI